MKNIFLAFIFIVLSFTAHSVFAADPSVPACSSQVNSNYCSRDNELSVMRDACYSYPDSSFQILGSCGSGRTESTCNYSCSCPAGQVLSSSGFCEDLVCPVGQKPNTVMTGGGLVTSCVDDDGGESGGDDCEFGSDSNGVCYSEDCPFGDGTPEACANNSSSSSSVPPVCVPPYYNDPVTGQCVIEESESSASSAASSEGGASSSAGASSSGNASSSGDSGSSAGNDSGDGDGDGDSGGGGSSSGGGTGGGGGGSGSSAGSGECDPTSKNYLECLGTKELEIPTESGSYDGVGTDSDSRIEELEGELNDLINQVTSEINDSIGVTLSGSGGLSDYTYSIKGVSVSFGWTRFASYLSLLGYAIIAAAYVAAFIIIMRH